jgi:hypothetical protein
MPTHFHSRNTSKTAPRWPGLPLRACVPRSGVCTSVPTHLQSRSVSKTAPWWPGLPLRSCVPRSGVCMSVPTHIQSHTVQRQCHDGLACPCERVFHAQVCARQCLHTSILVAHQRLRHDGACPSAGHGLGSLETGVSTEPFLVLTHLLQRASEFAALLADSPCCQQVWCVKDC